MKYTYPSIAKFQQLVELKDYRPATKKEYRLPTATESCSGGRVHSQGIRTAGQRQSRA